jgi:peptide/nickel transport system permease protein
MAMTLIVLVGVRWEWLPFMGISSDAYASLSGGEKLVDVLRHVALIGVCFLYPLVAYQVRFVRVNVLAVLGEDYIRTARAKGASEFRVATRHALPNVMLPLLTLVGLMLPAVLGGSVILEVMFSYPGMGRLMFESIMRRDYPVVMALSMLSAVVVLVGTLVVDLLYALADPRVKYR